MVPLGSNQPNSLHFASGQRKLDDPVLEQLIRSIVDNAKGRERKNRELDERNAELQRALNQANERIAHLETLTEQLLHVLETMSSATERDAREHRKQKPDTPKEDHHEPKAKPEAEESSSETVEPRPLTQRIELAASPLRNLASLSAFHHALSRLPGIVDVKAQEFDHGILTTTIEYSGSVPLERQLMELSGFDLRFVSIGENRIELLILDRDKSTDPSS